MYGRRFPCSAFLMFLAVIFTLGPVAHSDQIPNSTADLRAGRNVNMVSGTQLPAGDPWLQRQNEPSLAVSTRNPLHLLAGANDYRTVDIPQSEGELPGMAPGIAAGDAWLGVYKSFDGGQSWKSTLLPGFPQDISPEGMASPLKPYTTAADPGVRAGTNGLFYYSGIAFNRASPRLSALFLARYLDKNNSESSDPIEYVDTRILDIGNQGRFIDMPSIAVDVPRGSRTVTIGGQTMPAGNVYVVYPVFTGQSTNNVHGDLYFLASEDCGQTWNKGVKISEGEHVVQGARIAIDPSNGTIYVAWRRFAAGKQRDAILISTSTDFGKKFTKPLVIAEIASFDQRATDEMTAPPSGTSFRTNSYPTLAVDSLGFVHCAWAQKGMGMIGEARIVLSTFNGVTWSPPAAVTRESRPGHQFMPVLTFAADRLVLAWYDQQNTAAASFHPDWMSDDPAPGIRQTVDIYAAEAKPGPGPYFQSPFQVSRYLYVLGPDGKLKQAQYNIPNYALFKGGTTPFHGDYLDIAPSPSFILNEQGQWRFNIAPSATPVFHVAWTDNRDVRPPIDNDWTKYNPPVSNQGSYGSGACSDPLNVGMRNQNIYTARLSRDTEAGTLRNNKPLGTVGYDPDDKVIPRAFVLYARNYSYETRMYRFKVVAEPSFGNASFLEFTNLDVIDAIAAPNSTVARTVFVASTNPSDTVKVEVFEVRIDGSETLQYTVVLNQDATNPGIPPNDSLSTKETYSLKIENPSNPNIVNPNIVNWTAVNPNIVNPNIVNPNIVNPNIVNPNIVNPNIVNPNIVNPNIVNPNIVNPNIVNPNIVNPNIVNPNIVNPNIVNPNIVNMAVTDVNWAVTNTGNSTSTYNLKLYSKEQLPIGVYAQLIVYRESYTPAAYDGSTPTNPCALKVEPHHDVLLNVTNPNIVNPNIVNPNIVNPNIVNSALENAVFAVAPGTRVYVTVRIVDTDPTQAKMVTRVVQDRRSALKAQTVSAVFDLQTFAESLGTLVVAQAVNTEDAKVGITTPPLAATNLIIATDSLPNAIAGYAYKARLSAAGGTQSYTWSLNAGELPPGLTLSASGEISGTVNAGAGGAYYFFIRIDDAGGQFDTQRCSIYVQASTAPDPLAITTVSPLPSGVMGFWYGTTLEAVGGTWPRTWSLDSGSLPAGLTLGSNGTITGTPIAVGTFTFTVRVTDGAVPPQSVARSLTLYITPTAPGVEVTISGIVYNGTGTPLAGAVMRGLPNTPITGLNGYYEDKVPGGWSGTVIPFRQGYYFSPASRSYNSLSVSQSGQDYNGSLLKPPALASFVVDAPASATAGVPFAVAITAKDTNGNTTTNVSGATTLSVSAGTISPGSIPDTAFIYTGVWTGSVTLSGTGTITITAANSGATGSDTVSMQSVTSLEFKTQPGTATAGQSMPLVEVRALDASLAVIPGATITMSLGTSACTACTLSGGITAVTDGAGVARFSALLLDRGGWGYTLRASAGSPAVTATSDAFDVIGFCETGSMSRQRRLHTATVLADGRVLVAGGYTGGAFLSSAELYDPATGTWTNTGSLNTPRRSHTATLLPDGKVLIAGGFNGVLFLDSTEIYDPATGMWSITGSLGTGRYQHAAILLSTGKVLVVGGTGSIDGSSTYLASAELFDPAAGTWTATGSLNLRRSRLTSVTLLLNGMVLVAGGWGGPVNPESSAELYNPTTGTWSTTGSLMAGRWRNTATLLANGKVLIAGGRTGDDLANNYVDTVEIYDPTAGTWSPANSITTLRELHTATLLQNGEVLISGGSNASGLLSSAERYNPVTGTWMATGFLSDKRSMHTASLLSDGKVILTGGYTLTGTLALFSAELYFPDRTKLFFAAQPAASTANQAMPPVQIRAIDKDGKGIPGASITIGILNSPCIGCTISGTTTAVTDAGGNVTLSNLNANRGGWGYRLVASASPPGVMTASEPFDIAGFCATGDLAGARYSHTSTLLPDGRMLVAGGVPAMSGSPLASAELYDPKTERWSATGSLGSARVAHTATLLPNGKVLVAGGRGTGVAVLATAELYDPGAGTWSSTGPMTEAREWHTATLLHDGRVLVTGGGYSLGNFRASAEIYNPTSGTWSTTGSMATGRQYHTATLLANGKVLVAGGRGTGEVSLATAEIYDPVAGAWSPTGSLNAPRQVHAATLLPNGKVLVVGFYGGGTASLAELYDPVSGTWSASGNTTTALFAPTLTLLHNGKVLLAGGFWYYPTQFSGLYDPASDTWSVGGQLVSPRYIHTATLLPDGRVVLAGGSSAGTGLSSVELYYPARSVPTGQMMAERGQGHTVTALPNGKILVAGGIGSSGSLSGAELYDPAGGTWSGTGAMSSTRSFHTATLLPDGRVLVAGGSSGSDTLNSAELYDVATGLWSSPGTMAAARASHAATLLPNGKVLVAGGSVFSSHLAGAELYDPVSGSWSQTGAMSAGRASHTMTLLPNGIVLAAGGTGASGLLSSAERYNPASGTWQAAGSLGDARQSHTATLLSNGKVLIAGGYDSTLGFLSSAELYEPDTGTWGMTGSLGMARSRHTATLLSNGQVLAAGGWIVRLPEGLAIIKSSTELYDPSAGTWSFAGSMSLHRIGHYAALLSNGKVLIVGGTEFGIGALASTELFSPWGGTDSWSLTGSLITAREGSGGMLLANGRVLAFGGADSLGAALATSELYNQDSGTWSATGPLVEARQYGFRGTLLGNGKVLVSGGFGNAPLSGAELYDPASGTWTATGSLPAGRRGHTATRLSNGMILIAGGRDDASTANAELYDPTAGSWSATGSLASPRQGHSAVPLYNGLVLVVGGYYGESDLATAELYNPSTGAWSSTGSLTWARRYFIATRLPDGKVLVAGGQNATGYLSSVEVYDPVSGTWSVTGSMITARQGGRARLLPNGLMLVAGGINSTGFLSSAELYDVASGTWRATHSMKDPRQGHNMIPLPNGKILVVGGYNSGGTLSSVELYDPAMVPIRR